MEAAKLCRPRQREYPADRRHFVLSRPATTVMIPEISTRKHAATPRAVGRLLTLHSEWVHDKYSENGPRPSRPRRHSPERERI